MDKKFSLGIEFGSTNIKLIIVDSENTVVDSSSYSWENKIIDSIWTYSEEDIYLGMKTAFDSLSSIKNDISSLGISAMMHGYIALDENDNLLVPFRTWRNTITKEATDILSELFQFNIPQRWSIAHLYQAILNGEEHTKHIKKVCTLASFIHYKLTGNFVIGVGDASGMFPIDSKTATYNSEMVDKFNILLKENNLDYTIEEIFPKVLVAGENAGYIKENNLLSQNFKNKVMLAPPEGDAGTGMVATNSIAKSTGNVSAGTSVFAMIVLEKQLSKMYREIDMVTTPDGFDVAMVHCNNCTSDLNAWAELLKDFADKLGISVSTSQILSLMFASDKTDYTDLLSYNYFSGEHLTHFTQGRPLLTRKPTADFSFNNFSRASIYSSLATLRLGMDILTENEKVRLTKLLGHGGFFKSAFGATALASAVKTPVSIMETAGEGGAFGMAVLANFALDSHNLNLSGYLDSKVFKDAKVITSAVDEGEAILFDKYIVNYTNGLKIEAAAVDNF